MANPQREDGHVDIANEIVEALAKTYLSSYESQVLWAIFRKTYGWHKKEDWLTNTQIMGMTGIAESHVSRTVKKLIKRNMVNKNGKKLSFQKDYEKWGKIPKQVSKKNLPKQDINLPEQVTKITQTGKKNLPKQVDTKETKRNYTKETIQKKGDIFLKAWKDFKEMRKKIKKPMTEKAEEMLFNSLNKLSKDKKEQVAILNQSIFHCWQGVFPLKERPQDNENQPKYIPKKAPKLTAEQIEKNKERVTELVKGFKNKFDIPIGMKEEK